MFSIGFNIFLDDLQEKLIDNGTEIVENVAELSSTASYWAGFYENYVHRIPYVGSPERMEEAKKTKRTVQQTEEFTVILRPAANIIKLMSIFIWFPILVIAVPWLTLDLVYGSKGAKRLVFSTLILAAPFNAITYFILNISFSQAVEDYNFLNYIFEG